MRRYGERFIFGFDGRTITGLVEEMIIEKRISGVVLFSRNMKDVGQAGELCRGLQELRRRVSELPLIIAVDHEGGNVQRITEGITHFPSPMAIAATGDPGLADRVGYCMGCELMSIGINMNFAPVLDINTNKNNPVIGVRSFGDDPARVAAFGAAMIAGLERAGVAAVAKHFPGMGFAEDDPHMVLPDIPKEMDELDREDLLPFREAVSAGVSGIMVGHARYPALSARPASLSRSVIADLLRGRLGFGGVAITDDLDMGGVLEHRSAGAAAVKACGAGADLLLICHSSAEQIGALGDISRAISSGKLRSEHIKGSLSRIRDLKERIRKAMEASSARGLEDGESIARQVAEAALTLYRDDGKILPIPTDPGSRILLMLPRMAALSAAEDTTESAAGLGDLFRDRYPGCTVFMYGVTPQKSDFAEVSKLLSDAGLVIMGTCNAHLSEGQSQLVAEVAAAGKPSIFIAMRNPYDMEIFPPGAARIATYGSDPHMIDALARLLFGEITARGTVPVKLST